MTNPFVEPLLFGSNTLGLSLPSSDVDILLFGLQCTNQEESAAFLSHLGYIMNNMGWVVDC